MNALANRQEGRAVGMVSIAATGTPDDCRQADSNAEQNEPDDEQCPQAPARGLHLKRNDQAWHVDQDDRP